MPRWVKEILGVLLVPLCFGFFRVLQSVIATAGDSLNVWIPMGSGAGCWLVVYIFMPRQTWLYVVGHELTHVVWSWAFGGELRQFKIGAKGGHVVVSKSNFLVALAPYFFPLYAMMVGLIFGAVHFFWPKPEAVPVFHLLLGGTYAFHVTWTLEILRTRQSDIEGQGYLFSAVVVALGNLLVLICGIALLSGQPPAMDVLAALLGDSLRAYQSVWGQIAYWFRGSA